jgi:hypothetical protein
VFVVSSSQLGARERDIRNAMQLMQGPGVRHYWDGERLVGAAVRRFVPGLTYPAWDVWMLYAPGATWADEPPEPDWWEHQLSSLGHEFADRLLDAERFAAKAAELAARPATSN